MADLITLEEYKLYEGVNSTQYDDKFEQLITSVSQLVRTYCANEFDAYVASPGVTEEFNIQWDTSTLQLDHSPVIGVDNVFIRNARNDTYTEIYGDGTNGEYYWYLDSATDTVYRTTSEGRERDWPKGVQTVKIVYRAGYTSIPQDLKLAVADLITYYHKDEWKERQSIGSATREGAGASAIRNDSGFPDHIRRILDLYRDV